MMPPVCRAMASDANDRIALVTGLLLIGLGSLVLIGWWTGITSITRIVPEFPTMKANTAAGFLIGGAGLLVSVLTSGRWRLWLVIIAASLLMVGGLVSFLEYRVGSLGDFDQWLALDLLSDEAPGRPSEITALSFVFSGLALLMVAGGIQDAKRLMVFNLALLGSVFPALIGIFTYLYQPQALFGISSFSTMALHTCVGFIVFALGLSIRCRDCSLSELFNRNSDGGRHFRRLMVPILLFPILAGWGLYRLAFGVMNPAFATVVFAVLTTLVSLVALAASARTMDRWSEALKREVESRRVVETRLSLVWQSAQAAVLLFRADGRVHEFNPGALQLFGHDAETMATLSLPDLLPERIREQHKEYVARFIADPARVHFNLDDPRRFVGLRSDGVEVPVIATVSKHYMGGVLYLGAVLFRVPELAATLDRLINEAEVDALTGAHNRHALEQRVRQLRRYGLRQSRYLGVLMLDIDYFKRVNDEFGHLAGDQVIKAFATRIQGVLRSDDDLYRFGGEEFVCLVWFEKASDLIRVAERIRRQLARDLLSPAVPRAITTSIGISAVCPNGHDLDRAIARADRALYQAKESGRDCYRLDLDATVPGNS